MRETGMHDRGHSQCSKAAIGRLARGFFQLRKNNGDLPKCCAEGRRSYTASSVTGQPHSSVDGGWVC